MHIYDELSYLKESIILVANYPSNKKMIDMLGEILEKTETKYIVDRDTVVLLEILKRAISAVNMGLVSKEAIIKHSLDDLNNPNVQEIMERYDIEPSRELITSMMDLYSILLENKPLLDSIDNIIEQSAEVKKSSGILKKIESIKRLKNSFSSVNDKLEKIADHKEVEELLITDTGYGGLHIGLGRLLKDRELENSFVLKINNNFDKVFGGGLKLRKFYDIVSRSQGFKSGTMSNIAQAIKDNPENKIPEEFLDGKKPLILVITHENTVIQTVKRHLKYKGISNSEMASWSAEKFEQEVIKLMEPGANGIHMSIVSLPSKAVTVADIDKMYDNYERNGYKIILLIEDYMKHIATKLDNTEQNMLSGDKIAIELSDLAKKRYAPVLSATQLNREGVKVLKEKKRSTTDYITHLHEGYIADSYNAFQSMEMCVVVDRGEIDSTGQEYFVMYSLKDRDNEKRDTNKKESTDYLVTTFADDVGFRIEPNVRYSSLADLNPNSNKAVADVFNTMSLKLLEQRKEKEALEQAKKILEDNGINHLNLDDLDILERARHIVELSSDYIDDDVSGELLAA